MKPTVKSFSWQLAASRDQLWPLLSDTERLNEAMGLKSFHLHEEMDEYGRRLFGEYQEDDTTVRWEELPMEWVAPHWWKWEREYEGGPFERTCATLILTEGHTGSTEATYKLEVIPRGTVGQILLMSGHLQKAARHFEHVAKLAATHCRKPRGDFFSAFVDGKEISGKEDIEPALHPLAEWIGCAPQSDVQRLHPKRIAKALDIELHEALQLCDKAQRAGLLDISVELRCESCCRITQQAKIPARIALLGRCRHCGNTVKRDLGRNVELIFQPAFSLRDIKDTVYCCGSPARNPERLLMQNMEGLQRRNLEVKSVEGMVRARILNGPSHEWIETKDTDGLRIRFGEDWIETEIEGDVIALENHSDKAVQVLLERAGGSPEMITVAHSRAVQSWQNRFDSLALGLGQQEAGGQMAILAIRSSGQPSSAELTSNINEAGGAHIGMMSGCVLFGFLTTELALSAARGSIAQFPSISIGASFGEIMMSGSTATPSVSGPPIEIALLLADNAEAGQFEMADSFDRMMDHNRRKSEAL